MILTCWAMRGKSWHLLDETELVAAVAVEIRAESRRQLFESCCVDVTFAYGVVIVGIGCCLEYECRVDVDAASFVEHSKRVDA